MEKPTPLATFCKECTKHNIFFHKGIGKLNVSKLSNSQVWFEDVLKDVTYLGESITSSDVFKARTPSTISGSDKPNNAQWFSTGE